MSTLPRYASVETADSQALGLKGAPPEVKIGRMCAIAHEQHEQGEGRRESLHVDICEKDFNVGVLVLPNLQCFLSRPFSRTAKLASINVSFLCVSGPIAHRPSLQGRS